MHGTRQRLHLPIDCDGMGHFKETSQKGSLNLNIELFTSKSKTFPENSKPVPQNQIFSLAVVLFAQWKLIGGGLKARNELRRNGLNISD